MLQRIFILKSTALFNDVPGSVLAAIAPLLEEESVMAKHPIFQKGDIGKSMYVIIDGWVRIHDGDKKIAILKDRDVFGEFTVLSPEPRMASATAEDDVHLFRLDQDILYELMAENIEVAKSLIQVLVKRLR